MDEARSDQTEEELLDYSLYPYLEMMKEDLLDGMTIWEDNADENAWYYIAVQEATNSHDNGWIPEGDEIVDATTPAITTQCLRVPVSDGHTAAVFMKGQEKYIGGHQHADIGNFQIYYKGMLAINGGIYEGQNGGFGYGEGIDINIYNTNACLGLISGRLNIVGTK